MEYLDFELPIKELEDQLEKCQVIGQESDVDVTTTCKQINKKLIETKKNIYKNLTAWQRVQLSRHPNRPYTLDHINALCGDTFLELHGDRAAFSPIPITCLARSSRRLVPVVWRLSRSKVRGSRCRWLSYPSPWRRGGLCRNP